ncbi:MAG: hypothetical protein Q8R55_07155 [Candidatus Taylorbacteria bacterium]|nr:hypothetical protein [Candidatus Taylorbacteria bacterium]
MRNIVRELFISTLIIGAFFISVSGANANTLGQRETFFVNKEFDKYGRTSLQATLQHAGNKSYFYVEDNYWNSLGSADRDTLTRNIQSLANDFDANIYPKETQFWGSDPNPGVDGDSKITILLEELIKNNGGYFETSNGYLRDKAPDSNQREMITVSVEILKSNVSLPKAFLAHEFQHLISFNQKELVYNISEEVWLNELRSEYAVSQVGYGDPFSGSSLERRMEVFLDEPSDSLTEWPNKTIDYGIAALFAEYLVEQYGVNILSETLRDNSSGINSLNKFLAEKGHRERFGDVFVNWMAAVYLNNSLLDSRLGYKNSELKNIRVQPQQRVSLSRGSQFSSLIQGLKDWQPAWLEFDLGSFSDDLDQSAKIEIFGESNQNFLTAYLAFYGNGQPEFGRIQVTSGKGNVYIINSDKKLNKIAVLATKATKFSDFGPTETAWPLSFKVSMIETKKAVTSVLKDGALIRKRGEKETYVIWGKYKRYLTPGVIALYGHLNSANAIEVEPEIFHSYTTSNYVKYINDERVYAVWPDESKHWLNITPQQWDASNRDWGAIFTINDLELNFYKTGVDIIR